MHLDCGWIANTLYSLLIEELTENIIITWKYYVFIQGAYIEVPHPHSRDNPEGNGVCDACIYNSFLCAAIFYLS